MMIPTMLDIQSMLVMQVLLLCLMVVGVVTVKAGIVDERSRSSMSELVLCVFLPCNILASFFGTQRSQLPSLGIMLAISVGILGLSFVLSQVLFRRAGTEQKKVLVYAMLISNASFLGIPVVESVYGAAGLPYVAVYLMPLRVALWTVGLAIFTGGKGGLRTVFLHPCMIATYAGLIVMLTDFTPPALVLRLVSGLGNCTTALSMMVVGNILAQVDPKKLMTPLAAYFTVVRLVLVPLVVMGILLLFRPDPVISGVSVILSGMPAGATTSLLADKYGADRELASRIVFASTLLSIVTAPAMVWLLQYSFVR